MARFKFLATAILVLFVLSATALAQTSKGFVVGTVVDPNGAVVAGATVRIVNTETGTARETVSQSDGSFRLEAVDPGTYRAEISATGFKSLTRENIVVAAAQTIDISSSLELGNPSESVTITSAETVELQTADGTRVNTLSTRQITDLPVAGLNPVNLVFTLPGVTAPGNLAGGFVQGTEFNVNGLRARNNNELMDGLDNNDNSIAGQNYQPVLRDGYSEVTVLQGDFSAEYGRAGGAVVNVISRNGTNEFHGSAYDIISNSAFDARTPKDRRLDVKKPVQVENTFGGSLGGPIVKNKLFFFGTFQPDLVRSTTNASGVVPSAAGVASLRALFPAGTSSNLDAYLAALGDVRATGEFIDVPLGGGRPDIQFGTAAASAPQPVNDYQGLFRVDWTPSTKNSFSFRYLFDKQIFSNQFPSIFPGYEIDVPSLSQNFLFNFTRTISPTTTNEFRLGYVRTSLIFAPRNSALLDAGPYVVFASSSLSNFNLDPTFPQGRRFNNYQLQDTLSHTVGNHTFRMGFDLLKQKAREAVPFGDRGTLNFTQDAKGNFSDFANFVDQFSGVQGQFGNKVFGSPVIYPEPFYQNYFINDNWRARPNLTLNLGLRYENYGTPFNVVPFPAFDITKPFPTRVEQKRDNNNFAPRVSFAYTPNFWKKLLGEDRTVIRGGFAINYDFFFSNILENTASATPNALGFASFGSDAGPLNQFPRGLANSTIFGSLPTAVVGDPSPFAGITSIVPDLKNPESYVWNFGIQRELPHHIIADVAYVGSRGLKQFLNVEFNPRKGPINGFNPSPRINPNFGSVFLRTNSGDSTYHSLQARLERGFTSGVFFRLSYTYSKAIDDVNSEVFTTSGGSTRPTDPFDLHGGLRADRSVASYDVPHRFVATALYDIPSPFSEGFGKKVFSGFTISGIYRIQSGNVDTPYVGGIDLDRDGSAFNDRPGVANPNAPATSVAFDSNLFGFPTPTGFFDINGNTIALNDARFVVSRDLFRNSIAGRNTLRAPARSSLDLSLQRSFGLGFTGVENLRFSVRADFFNVLNQNQCQFEVAGTGSGNVLTDFFNQPTRNECGSSTQYNRTGRIELRFSF
jgi:outer membrane receptor protein involved in Fe transport